MHIYISHKIMANIFGSKVNFLHKDELLWFAIILWGRAGS